MTDARYDFYLEFDGRVYRFRSALARMNFIEDNGITSGRNWCTEQGDKKEIDGYRFGSAPCLHGWQDWDECPVCRH